MNRTTDGKSRQAWRKSSRGLALALLSAALLSGCGDSPEQMLASAKDYLAKNDANAAAIQLKNALQEDGNLVEARFLLGRINLEQGDVAAAVRDLQRASELGHSRTEVLPLLARARIRAGEFDRVLTDFASLTLDDTVAQGRLLGAVADAHLGKANLPEAIKVYQQALALRAEDAEAGIEAALAGGMKAMGVSHAAGDPRADWCAPCLEGLGADDLLRDRRQDAGAGAPPSV